jgi:outer membrane protein assembly factor BamB
MRTALIVALFFVGLTCLTPNVAAEEGQWSRFRGPNGTGISDAKTIPTQWTDKDYNWAVKLPGKGSSSPVIWGDRIFLTSSDGRAAKRSVLCLSTKNGKILWRHDEVHQRYRMHRDNDFASATPTVDGNGVVVVWSTPKQLLMLALDLDGKEMWRKDLGPYVGMHGSGSSPIIVGDQVILANDQMSPKIMKRYLSKGASMVPGKSYLIAMDRKTGKTNWKLNRKTILAGYATPCIRQVEGGKPELIFVGTAHGITSVDPITGKVNWEIDNILRSRTVASPQLYGNLVYASHGVGVSAQYFVAVRPEPKGGAGKAKIVFEVTKAVPLVPSFLIKDDLLFLWTDGGIVTCLDAATGKQHWRERVDGSYYTSPIWIDGHIYGISKDGDVVVLSASKTFRKIAQMELDERCYAGPAVAGGVMYIRTTSKLYSIGGKAAK